MRDIKEIVAGYEVKIAGIYAIIVFLIVFIIGLLNHIEFKTIIKRIFISELFFIPMGLIIGHVCKPIFRTPSTREDESHDGTSQQSADMDEAGAGGDAGGDLKGKNQDEMVGKGENAEISNVEAVDIEGNAGNEDAVADISLVDDEFSHETGVAEEHSKADKLSSSSLGKHIIVDDKKIINDPKLMAEAVRTMMNKKEE